MAPKKMDWKRINPSTDFRYHPPRSSGLHDGFSVKVECRDPDDGQFYPLIHQGPMLAIPFGLKKKEGNYGARYYCDMSFPGVTQDPDTQEFIGADEDALGFLKYMMAVDEENKSRALTQAVTWFKKPMKPDIIEEFYFKNISFSRKPQQYSPTFSTKIQCSDDGVFRTHFFNQYQKKLEFEQIGTGLRVIPLMEARSLWFAGKSFGMSWKLIQLMVFEREEFKGCAIDTAAYADYIKPERALAPADDEGYGEQYGDFEAEEDNAVVSGFNMAVEPMQKKPKVEPVQTSA